MSQFKRTKILLVGQISPTTTVIFKTCQHLENVDLYYVDVNTGRPAKGKSLLGCFTWIEYSHGWLNSVKEISQKFEEIFVICVSYDVAKSIYALQQSSIKMLYTTEDVIKIAQSKLLQNEIAKNAGFKLLPTYYSHDENFKPENYKYPLVVRPTSEHVAANFKVEIIHQADSLRDYSRQCDVVAQTFAQGMKVVIHASRDEDGTVLQFYYQVPISFAGFTVLLEKIEPIEELITAVENMLCTIAFVGVCHFEVIEDGGTFYFLDLNLRLGGTTGKAYKLGYNEFYQLLKIYEITPENIINKIHGSSHTVVSKVALAKALVAVLRGTWKQTDFPHQRKLPLVAFILKEIFTGTDELYSLDNFKISLFFLLDYFLRAAAKLKIKLN